MACSLKEDIRTLVGTLEHYLCWFFKLRHPSDIPQTNQGNLFPLFSHHPQEITICHLYSICYCKIISCLDPLGFQTFIYFNVMDMVTQAGDRDMLKVFNLISHDKSCMPLCDMRGAGRATKQTHLVDLCPANTTTHSHMLQVAQV